MALASGGVSKTRIVYRANLNFKMAKDYFEFLISKGYMTRRGDVEEGVKFYDITDKGAHLLQTLQHVEAQLEGLFPSENGQRRNPSGHIRSIQIQQIEH